MPTNMPNDKESNELPQLTDEQAASLQAELSKYKTAMEEEFKLEAERDPENILDHTAQFFRAHVPSAAAQIQYLSENADSESVRLAACKMIIERGLAEGLAGGDPIKALLNELKGNDPKKKAKT
jgi:lipid II:glycine glycyltransferase (peptidoglycan interpeptide bridge formation enzyme)